MKFGPGTNSDKQNSLVMFTFQFSTENILLGKFGKKNLNCWFKLKFGMETDLNMQNLMVVFILSALDWTYPFCTNFNCWFKLKFGTFANSNMENSIWCSLFQF